MAQANVLGTIQENVIWTGSPYRQRRPIGGGSIGLGILGVFFVLGGAFYLYLGFGFGVVLVVIGILPFIYIALRLRNPKATISYVITDQRAIVYEEVGESRLLQQQCDLKGASAVIMNQRHEQVSRENQYSSNQSIHHSTSRTVGDLVFMKGAASQAVFTNIADPQGVKQMADQVISALGA